MRERRKKTNDKETTEVTPLTEVWRLPGSEVHQYEDTTYWDMPTMLLAGIGQWITKNELVYLCNVGHQMEDGVLGDIRELIQTEREQK